MKTLQSLLLLTLVFCLNNFVEAGTLKTSFYSNKFNGRLTASGERFYQTKHTAASNRYKFGTILQLSYQDKSVRVCINDTGSFGKYGRDLDVTKAVARKLDFTKLGIAQLDSKVIYKPKKPMTCEQAWAFA